MYKVKLEKKILIFISLILAFLFGYSDVHALILEVDPENDEVAKIESEKNDCDDNESTLGSIQVTSSIITEKAAIDEISTFNAGVEEYIHNYIITTSGGLGLQDEENYVVEQVERIIYNQVDGHLPDSSIAYLSIDPSEMTLPTNDGSYADDTLEDLIGNTTSIVYDVSDKYIDPTYNEEVASTTSGYYYCPDGYVAANKNSYGWYKKGANESWVSYTDIGYMCINDSGTTEKANYVPHVTTYNVTWTCEDSVTQDGITYYLDETNNTIDSATYTSNDSKPTTSETCDYVSIEPNDDIKPDVEAKTVFEQVVSRIGGQEADAEGWIAIDDYISINVKPGQYVTTTHIYQWFENEEKVGIYTFGYKLHDWHAMTINGMSIEDVLSFSESKEVNNFEWYIYNTSNEDATKPYLYGPSSKIGTYSYDWKQINNFDNIKLPNAPTQSIYYKDSINAGAQDEALNGEPTYKNWGVMFYETDSLELGNRIGQSTSNAFALIPFNAKNGNKVVTQIGDNYVTRVPYVTYSFDAQIYYLYKYRYHMELVDGYNGLDANQLSQLPAVETSGNINKTGDKKDYCSIKQISGDTQPEGAQANAFMALMSGSGIYNNAWTTYITASDAASGMEIGANTSYMEYTTNYFTNWVNDNFYAEEAEEILSYMKSLEEGSIHTLTDNNGHTSTNTSDSKGRIDRNFVVTLKQVVQATIPSGDTPYFKLCINLGNNYEDTNQFVTKDYEDGMSVEELLAGFPAGTQATVITMGEACDCTKFEEAVCPDACEDGNCNLSEEVYEYESNTQLTN